MAGPNIYQVTSGENTYSVNLLDRTCGCRKWDVTSMPCHHAVSAIVKAKLQSEDFVADFFKKEMYKKHLHISYFLCLCLCWLVMALCWL